MDQKAWVQATPIAVLSWSGDGSCSGTDGVCNKQFLILASDKNDHLGPRLSESSASDSQVLCDLKAIGDSINQCMEKCISKYPKVIRIVIYSLGWPCLSEKHRSSHFVGAPDTTPEVPLLHKCVFKVTRWTVSELRDVPLADDVLSIKTKKAMRH